VPLREGLRELYVKAARGMRVSDLFFHRTFPDCLDAGRKPANTQPQTNSCPAPCHPRARVSCGFSSETLEIYALHFNYT
jgi:hypothetical protein